MRCRPIGRRAAPGRRASRSLGTDRGRDRGRDARVHEHDSGAHRHERRTDVRGVALAELNLVDAKFGAEWRRASPRRTDCSRGPAARRCPGRTVRKTPRRTPARSRSAPALHVVEVRVPRIFRGVELSPINGLGRRPASPAAKYSAISGGTRDIRRSARAGHRRLDDLVADHQEEIAGTRAGTPGRRLPIGRFHRTRPDRPDRAGEP